MRERGILFLCPRHSSFVIRHFLLILAVLVLGCAGWMSMGRFHHPLAGIAVPEDPEQGPPRGSQTEWLLDGGAGATALASYHIRARVLSVKSYPYDGGAKYAPVDLALGWGPMSDWSVYDRLAISQRGRFYLFGWGPEGPPIPRRAIEIHSSNNHVIPADSSVRRALRRVRPNDVIRMDGSLVEVRAPDGFLWRSSLTREDTGGTACELIRATSLVIEENDE